MRQYSALAIASAGLAGCSLVYNPNNLPVAHDAAIDAEIVDPTMFDIDDVAPRMIYEGQGELGSQPAIIVIHGKNIIDSHTVVEITPVSRAAQLVLGAPVIASNGHWIAIPVTAKVDVSLGKTDLVALDVKVSETLPAELGGGTPSVVLHDLLALVGLKELTRLTTPEVSGSNIDTTKLEPLYSKVDLQGIANAQLVGADRAQIRSVSSISAATTTITASGGAGGGGNSGGGAGAAIAGGCPGGGAGSRGGCGSLIGGDGGSASSTLGTAGGGGGGGFADVGFMGTGVVAGVGGSGTGDALIVTYDGFAGRTMNRAGGGGGGGNPMLSGKGGGGGAGGGSVELTAGGDLSVSTITADGGPGGPASSGLNGQAAGGGGGAGGLVMLRTDGALTTAGTVSVKGGDGGVHTGSNGDGGAGSDGRVRWDAVTGGAPTAPNGTVHRGPAFKLDAQVFRSATPSITVLGTTNDRFDVHWTSGGMTYMGSTYSIGTTGATIKPALQPGYNRLCLTLDGGQQGASEADKCVDVAYLP